MINRSHVVEMIKVQNDELFLVLVQEFLNFQQYIVKSVTVKSVGHVNIGTSGSSAQTEVKVADPVLQLTFDR